MNVVSTERVSVEIFTCVCSDQNNLSVPSPLNLCCPWNPNACRAADGSLTVEEQHSWFVPALRFSLLPSLLASLREPTMHLDFYLPPSAVSFSYWEKDLQGFKSA